MVTPGEEAFVPLARRLALLFGLLVLIALPSGYFGLKYSNRIEHVQTAAEIKARAVNVLVYASPTLWLHQVQRLEDALRQFPVSLDQDAIAVRDGAGNLHVSLGVIPEVPVLVRSAPIMDSGRVVGFVEITHSYRDVVLGTLGVGALALVLSVMVYLALLALPLHAVRALRRANEALVQGQEALRESEARFRSLTEMSSDFYWESDAEHRLTMRGSAATKESAVSVFQRGAQIGERRWEIPYVSPDEAGWQAHRADLDAHRPFRNFELSRHGADGREHHISISGNPVFDASGEFRGYRGVGTDITERKQVELDLLRFRVAMDATPDAVYVVDRASMKYVDISAGACSGLGLTREQILAAGPEGVLSMPRADIARIYDEVIAAEGGVTAPVEMLRARKDGKLVWIEVRRQAQRYGNGWLIITVVRDITKRRRSEDALRESENRLSTIFHANPIGISVTRAVDGKLLEVNDAMLRMYGRAREEALGRTVEELGAYARLGKREELLQRLRERGSVEDFPIDFLRKNGTYGVMELSGRVIDLQGEQCLIAMMVDVTERMQVEKEKAVLENQLQQAQKMESVGRLAGGVAHDFNNMLTVIRGNVALAIEQADPTQPIYTDLVEIRKAADRSADLTRQLLAFARKQVVAPKALNLNEAVLGILNMLQRLIGEDISLKCLSEANLWPVRMDPSQLDQILTNLCVNARDAIAGVGSIVIETGNNTFDEDYCAAHSGFVPGDYVRIAISDNGRGMDKETLAQIFEPFFTTKGVGEGTGLGLATVYGAVKQNNGFIDVDSEPGSGTTFTIYLPRDEGGSESGQSAGTAGPLVRGQETILVVDDEPTILNLTARILARQGYIVLSARGPGEAMRLVDERTGAIHLLITDMVMPEMNGRDLSRNLLSRYPDLKVLFMSGYTTSIIVHQGVLDQDVNFIQKPFSIDDLAAKVRRVLDAK